MTVSTLFSRANSRTPYQFRADRNADSTAATPEPARLMWPPEYNHGR